jgi:hypothetical protein
MVRFEKERLTTILARTAALVLFLTALTPTPVVFAREQFIGGISVADYCDLLLGPSSWWQVLNDRDAYSWVCGREFTYSDGGREINDYVFVRLNNEHMDAACRSEYSRVQAKAKPTNKRNAYSWVCYISS